jgi:hypothetical protein
MPAFADHLGETKMWQVSVLVKNADKISQAVKAELTSETTPAGAAPATSAPQAGGPTAPPPAAAPAPHN